MSDADLVTIHSINLFPQYAAFTAAVRAGVPYVVTPHGALDPWLARNSPRVKRAANVAWQRRMLANAAAIHFTTAEEARLASGLTGSAPHVIVPNGLDISRFATPRSRGAFRRRVLNGFDGGIVMFLGRIARKKGIDLLIRAFALARPRQNWGLVIAGPDDEKLTPELLTIARGCGVQDRVHFVGPVYGNDQLDALAAADVWALTSHTENFGNAVVEAMAAGCPAVISNRVNLAPDIGAANAGVVTDLSIENITNALESVLNSPERREGLRKRGRDFACRFDWSIVAPELIDAFYSAAQRQPLPRPAVITTDN